MTYRRSYNYLQKSEKLIIIHKPGKQFKYSNDFTTVNV